MKFLPLIEQSKAADFQKLLENTLRERVKSALLECKVYVAQRMFLEYVDTRGAQQASQDTSKLAADAPRIEQLARTRERTAKNLHRAGLDYTTKDDDKTGETHHLLKFKGESESHYRDVGTDDNNVPKAAKDLLARRNSGNSVDNSTK